MMLATNQNPELAYDPLVLRELSELNGRTPGLDVDEDEINLLS